MKEDSSFRKHVSFLPEKVETLMDYRKPFVIRSHHLVNLAGASGFSPRDIVEGTLVAVGMEGHDYFTDVLGSTPVHVARFEASLTEFFTTFDKLPDDYPVKLVAGQKDGVCSGCAIGKHCSEKINLLGDQLFLADFDAVSEALGLADQVTFELEYVDTSDSGRVKTLSAFTTAGVTRSVLGVLSKQFKDL
ncbi:MAG TPA: hypothetical protein VNA13_02610 [Xanthomonadales bacterium]|nr:hypothetical protein [Xanthomonadales bacterium]